MCSGRESNYFNQYATTLVEHGFTVTPTKGKQPVFPRWQNPKPTDANWLASVLRSNRYADCNIGIVCGRVVAIDIDADDPAKSAQIEALATEHLGQTLFKRRGRLPRNLLLYRPVDSIASIKIAGCIDVLSGGRQFVAFGIHPDSQQPYQWAGPSPKTARLDDLPTITTASLKAFADAVSKALGCSTQKAVPTVSARTVDATLKSKQCARQGELVSTYDTRIMRGADGRVIDGREALLAKLIAAEYAKHTHNSPDDLANRVWSRLIEEADLSRPKGGNPKQRWSFKDALGKARAICRRKPELTRSRRSRLGHPTSHLHAWRRPGSCLAVQSGQPQLVGPFPSSMAVVA